MTEFEKELVEALEAIANNNWRDQSRAKTVAREALAKHKGNSNGQG